MLKENNELKLKLQTSDNEIPLLNIEYKNKIKYFEKLLLEKTEINDELCLKIKNHENHINKINIDNESHINELNNDLKNSKSEINNINLKNKALQVQDKSIFDENEILNKRLTIEKHNIEKLNNEIDIKNKEFEKLNNE